MWTILRRIPLQQKNVHLIRTLYSERALGLTKYEKSKVLFEKKITNSQFMGSIRTQPLDKLVKTTNLWCFTLKNESGDIDLLRLSLQRIFEEDQGIYSTKLGPLVMRMFYYLNLPAKALQFYRDFEKYSAFQCEVTSILLFDLLFNNGLYEELLDIVKKKMENAELSRMHMPLVIGACYKLNTPEHYETALKFWNECNTTSQLTQTKYFLAMLAVNQNDAEFASNLLTESDLIHRAALNIKLFALADMKDFDAISNILCHVKTEFEANSKRQISVETFERIQKLLNENCTLASWHRCNRVLIDFEHSVRMTKTTINEMLCWPITLSVHAARHFQPNRLDSNSYQTN